MVGLAYLQEGVQCFALKGTCARMGYCVFLWYWMHACLQTGRLHEPILACNDSDRRVETLQLAVSRNSYLVCGGRHPLLPPQVLLATFFGITLLGDHLSLLGLLGSLLIVAGVILANASKVTALKRPPDAAPGKAAAFEMPPEEDSDSDESCSSHQHLVHGLDGPRGDESQDVRMSHDDRRGMRGNGDVVLELQALDSHAPAYQDRGHLP